VVRGGARGCALHGEFRDGAFDDLPSSLTRDHCVVLYNGLELVQCQCNSSIVPCS